MISMANSSVPILKALIGRDDEQEPFEHDAQYHEQVRRRLVEIQKIALDTLEATGKFSKEVRGRCAVAAEEAYMNAIVHGNLERSSDLRQKDSKALPEDLLAKCNPYMHERTVQFEMRFLYAEAIASSVLSNHTVVLTRKKDSDDSDEESLEEEIDRYTILKISEIPDPSLVTGVEFEITDEGEGFEEKEVNDPTEPENLLKPSGRGLLLMRAFMDMVRFNSKGNSVTLSKNTDQ